MSDNEVKKRKLYKIIIKHPSIPFRICPSIPILVELDTVYDPISDYEVKIKLEYKEENSHIEDNTEESTINAIFREEMKKQNDLDDLITSKRRRGSLVAKGDDDEEYFLSEEESPNETIS